MSNIQRRDLKKKIAFFGLEQRVGTSIVRKALDDHAEGALDAMYAHISSDADLAALFGGTGAIRHARAKQKEHWHALFASEIDEQFFDRAEKIGQIHARIGLDPAWYVGGYALVIERIIDGMMRQSIRMRIGGKALSGALGSLVKSALFDMQVALSTYFEAANRERAEAVAHIRIALEALARGDVEKPLTGLGSEYRQIEQDYEAMRLNMRSTLLEVAGAASAIRTGSSEIEQASNELAERTELQASAIQETAAAMDEITATVRETAKNAGQLRRSVSSASEDAQAGGSIVEEAVGAMAAIQKSAEEITQIISLIDGIAFQTNLLALNAGVEAARAGDAERGFAVVASEVRALAQRSTDAAESIKQLIQGSSRQVESGVRLVGQTGAALGRIAGRVLEINALITDISNAAEEQATGISQVNIAVGSMDRGIQQNAAMCEEATAASKNLSSEAHRLATLVGRFTLDEDDKRANIGALGRRAAA